MISPHKLRLNVASLLPYLHQVAQAEVSAAAAAALVRVATAEMPAVAFSTHHVAPATLSVKHAPAVRASSAARTDGVAGAMVLEPRLLTQSPVGPVKPHARWATTLGLVLLDRKTPLSGSDCD